MTSYELLLFVHILAAAIWVGGGIVFDALARRARASGDRDRLLGVAADAEFLGKFVYPPASIVLLLAGIGLVVEGDWGFGHFWIIAGIAQIVIGGIMGVAFFGPRSTQLATALQTKEPSDPAVSRLVDQLAIGSRIEIALLVAVVFLMTTKPG